MNYWLIKSEPYKYSFDQLLKDGNTHWDGVRNFQARNNLRTMKVGDECLYYHSNEDKAVVGIAKITREAYQDPSTEDTNWVAVDVAPVSKLSKPVTLSEIKSNQALSQMSLLKQMRLSVCPVTPEEFDIVLSMGMA